MSGADTDELMVVCSSEADWKVQRDKDRRPWPCRVRLVDKDHLVSWEGSGEQVCVDFQQGPCQANAGSGRYPTCFFDSVVAAASLLKIDPESTKDLLDKQSRPTAASTVFETVLREWPLGDTFKHLRDEYIDSLASPSLGGGSANEVWNLIFRGVDELQACRGYLIYCQNCENLSEEEPTESCERATRVRNRVHRHRVWVTNTYHTVQELDVKTKREQTTMTVQDLAEKIIQDKQIFKCDICAEEGQQYVRYWRGNLPRYLAIDPGGTKIPDYYKGIQDVEYWHGNEEGARRDCVSYRFKLGIYRETWTSELAHFTCYGLDIDTWKASHFNGMALGGAIVSNIPLAEKKLPRSMVKNPQIIVFEITRDG